jgi:hypothetical protein
MGTSLNPNLNRWIYASVVKHFMAECANANPPIPFYIDRYDRDVSWVEMRFVGPTVNEVSRAKYLIICCVDFLITTFVEHDQYAMFRITGALSSMYKDICVYRYGDGLDDDQTFVSDLKLTQRNNNKINLINFGLILPDNKFQRSVMSSDYEMFLH